MANITREERFWSKVQIGTPDECWNWMGAKNPGMGYGKLLWTTKPKAFWRIAHRTAWELTYVMINDPKILVCHSCDNPLCCNPGHLFLGTHQANSDDKKRKGRGRWAKGESNGRAKLTKQDVLEIRKLDRSGMTQAAIGSRFGIKQPQVSRIVRGTEWKE